MRGSGPLFEGVGEVVLVENRVAGRKQTGKVLLGLVEAGNYVEILLVKAALFDAFDYSIPIVLSYHYGDVEVFSDVFAERLIQRILLAAKLNHAGSDNNSLTTLEVSQDIDSHLRTGGIGVERVVDDCNSARCLLDAQPMLYLVDRSDRITDFLRRNTQLNRDYHSCENIRHVALAEKARLQFQTESVRAGNHK